MRSSTVLAGAMAITACAGTEGDLLRSVPDAQAAGDAMPPPTPGPTWQIQLQGTLDTSFDVQVYTADFEETPSSVIADLHQAGRTVYCYFSAGTMEPFRSDASQFPPSSLGGPVAGYNETWVDIRNDTVRTIMQARISRAAAVGCDGIHPSGLDAFQRSTGFSLTRDDQLAYNRWLATSSHLAGLTIGLVEGDVTLRQDLLADFDWTVAWSCLSASTPCGMVSPFVNAGKASFLVEIGDASRVAEVCPPARALGLSAIIKRESLDAFRVGCP
jgi:hypothetical protein